jgi:hypothetical protein
VCDDLAKEGAGDSSCDTTGRVDLLYGSGLIGGDSGPSVRGDLMCRGSLVGLGKEELDSCSGGDSSRNIAGRVDPL